MPVPWPASLATMRFKWTRRSGSPMLLEDREGLHFAVVAEDEVTGAVPGQFGGVLLVGPAADDVLEAGRSLDRHDRGDVGFGREFGAHRAPIAAITS